MTIKKILPTALASAVVLSLALVSVHSAGAAGTDAGGQAATQTGGQAGGLQNPLNNVNSIGDFFYLVANFAYSLSYAVIAFFLIWSGFKFVTAQGNEEKLKDAKKTFYYTIIGAALLVGANVITEVVRTVINQFSRTQV